MRKSELVSVVIPTHARPRSVAHAVRSALMQSYVLLEIIVVVDGPDAETVRVLQGIHDERLRVIVLDENAGGYEARNAGVRAACGAWVAFLDDDDTWVADKLEKQMEAGANSQVNYPVISSRLVAHASDGGSIMPRRLYSPDMEMADYLFCRRNFSYGDGMLQTSTLMTRRSLLLEVPFQKGLKRHQDWDWLLKIAGRADVEIVMVPEALTLMRVSGRGESVSQAADWKTSLAWAKLARPRMSAKAYSFFIATECVPRARKCKVGLGTQMSLLWECMRRGRPSFMQMTLFFTFCMVPDEIRKSLRSRRARAVSIREWREHRQI